MNTKNIKKYIDVEQSKLYQLLQPIPRKRYWFPLNCSVQKEKHFCNRKQKRESTDFKPSY